MANCEERVEGDVKGPPRWSGCADADNGKGKIGAYAGVGKAVSKQLSAKAWCAPLQKTLRPVRETRKCTVVGNEPASAVSLRVD